MAASDGHALGMYHAACLGLLPCALCLQLPSVACPACSAPLPAAVNGLFAAKAAGCFAVGVATSLPSHMLEPHADLVLQHLCELDLAAVAPSRAR
jgi:hypothetical protein